MAPAPAPGPQDKPVKRVRRDIFESELGYKDASNPFGDATLTEKFVWKKKNEYLLAAGLFRKTSKEEDIDRIQSKVREIHHVKKRRDEREVEKLLLEQQRLEHDKEMHDEEYGEWLAKEESFHLMNAEERSLIRIEQGRERPIDLVAKGLKIAEGAEFEDMTILDKPPHQLFAQMGLAEVEDMITDIEIFVKHDTQHKQFWKAMLYVSQDAADVKQREKSGNLKSGAANSLGAGVADGVVSEIHELLSSKPKRELQSMLVEIEQSIQKGAAGMDTQFFDSVALKIPLYMARAEIDDWHSRGRQKADAWLETHEQPPAADDSAEGPAAADPAREASRERDERAGDWGDLPDGGPPDQEDLSPELEPLSALEERGGGAGALSPVLEPLTAYDPQDLLDPDEDERILREVRQTLIDAFREPLGGGATSSFSSSGRELDRAAEERLVSAERARGMEQGEVGFNAQGKGTGDDVHGEIDLPQRHYEWEDKYRPRKPRFFNRVKTGFEWNKYNQTHYDHDNPPPKTVQGYKFNIFYPDLIDKTKAPQYYLEKSETNETVTLRFHAGPPYEDVAFKIVNREWNLSHKFGFRVVFDRGVLQLYFNFKRWRYRR